eukprot:SAG31_NODE_384_length_16414_cov_7.492308_5_plen_88_part_00
MGEWERLVDAWENDGDHSITQPVGSGAHLPVGGVFEVMKWSLEYGQNKQVCRGTELAVLSQFCRPRALTLINLGSNNASMLPILMPP